VRRFFLAAVVATQNFLATKTVAENSNRGWLVASSRLLACPLLLPHIDYAKIWSQIKGHSGNWLLFGEGFL
jgi:hypothetical protein